MKKLLPIALISLIGINLNAQKNTVGIRTGVGRSTLQTDYADSDFDFSSKGIITAHVAIFLEHKLNENFALQTELGFARAGGRNRWNYQVDESRNYDIVNAISLGKLNIPLMAKYYFNENFNINAGANLAFVVAAESKYRTNGKDGLELYTNLLREAEDIKKKIKTFEVNPFLGVEFHLSKKIFIDGRYIFGISDISKNNNGEGYNKLKSSSFQIGIGFKFNKLSF
ncbi:PorT family protein [Chryseobacterium sp. Tr-659]|uniref:porin family protein n=1 Tax=Chryseobacterium sp. Tr-659 TaxID=2608340 RepID=UPI0014204C01|nr:porin family protein [Chryseobacterium sp. Tr-659]NIF04974.1 PorT family protein [Chryseobacterium sp. Tr-659]